MKAVIILSLIALALAGMSNVQKYTMNFATAPLTPT